MLRKQLEEYFTLPHRCMERLSETW